MPFAAFGEPFEEYRKASRVPARVVERPLSVPDDVYRLEFRIGGGQLQSGQPFVGFVAGASYGISDDFELGLKLVRVGFSPNPDVGLDPPTAIVLYRLLNGVYEAGLRLELEAPIGQTGYFFAFDTPMLMRFGSLLRLDFAPGLDVQVEGEWSGALRLPVSLDVQIAEGLSVGAFGEYLQVDLGTPTAVVTGGARAAYTFNHRGQAICELSLDVRIPYATVNGPDVADPSLLNHAFAGFALRWFLANTESDPFRDF